jgi:hypothetical protein
VGDLSDFALRNMSKGIAKRLCGVRYAESRPPTLLDTGPSSGALFARCICVFELILVRAVVAGACGIRKELSSSAIHKEISCVQERPSLERHGPRMQPKKRIRKTTQQVLHGANKGLKEHSIQADAHSVARE